MHGALGSDDRYRAIKIGGGRAWIKSYDLMMVRKPITGRPIDACEQHWRLTLMYSWRNRAQP